MKKLGVVLGAIFVREIIGNVYENQELLEVEE